MTPPFPVLEERSLTYITKRFMRGAKRDLNDLPTVRPGSVLVFRQGTQYAAFEETRHLTGGEAAVVDATAVCLVDMRPREFPVEITLPSASAADDFTIKATFRARVTDPERAAEEGPIRIEPYLAGYLEKDRKLASLGSDYRVQEIAKLRPLVVTRVQAYCECNPIYIPGLSVVLVSASVTTPYDVRVHEKKLRDEQWEQEINELRAQGEGRNIRRHKEIVEEGADALTALGITRGETTISEAIINARDDEQRLEARFAETIKILQQNGSLDYLDIDPNEMVHAYLEKFTGQKISRSKRRGLRRGDSENRGALGPGPNSEDDEPPDEDDLDA